MVKQSVRSALLALLLVAVGARGEVIHGKVIRVTDGDSITVLDSSRAQHKIRLAGIDAPERGQAFGQASKRSLSEQVAGKDVEVDWGKIDRYDRKVGKVLHRGKDVNLTQIERGLAWHYKDYQSEQSEEERRAYATAEEEARDSRKGLWKSSAPMPPWECRQAMRHGETCR